MGYEILKVFNNNVLLAKHHATEKVLIKKGIGFGRKSGEVIPEDIVFDKVFSMESHETTQKFNQLLATVDPSLVGICEELLWLISSEVKENINEEAHIRLIDHIAFTIYRIQHNDKIENPYIVEIETFYEREYAIAQKVVTQLIERLGIDIPDSEVGFIALHIHSLCTNGKLSNTLKCAYICNSAIEVIEDELQMEIDHKSIDYARFLCHIRFTVERVTNNIPIKNELLSSIKKTYKDSYKLAKKITRLMEEELYLKVPEGEIGFVAMHIERLKNVSAYVDKRLTTDYNKVN